MIPVLVISLDRALDRRTRIGAHLSELGVPFSFLSASEGDAVPRYTWHYERNLSPGEVGCYVSHVRAARAIVEAGERFVCVLEDDAVLETSAIEFLKQDVLALLPEFDILRLEALWHGRHKKVATVAGINVCTTLYPDGGMRAQIYSQGGARKVANCRSPIVSPIDVHLYYDPPIRPFKLLDVSPACARELGTASLIGHRENCARRSLHRNLRYKIRRRLNYAITWGVTELFQLSKRKTI
jgi:glycosyl transferase family 25